MSRQPHPFTLCAAVLTALAVAAVSGCSSPVAAHPAASVAAHRTAAAVPLGRLLFRRYSDATQISGALLVSSTDGSEERQIVAPKAGVAIQDQNWSSDGSRIVFTEVSGGDASEAHRLFTVHADGSGLRALTPGRPADGTSVPGFDDSAAFSPDGSLIAYVHAEGTVANDELQHSDVYVMHADGSGARRITHYAAYSGDSGGIAWSPDGRRLVVGRSTPAGTSALYVMGVDGSGSRRLTPTALGAGGSPDWTAHGDLIAFRVAAEDTGVGDFYTVRSDGSHLRQVTHLGGKKISHKIAFSPDGTWLAFAMSDPGSANDMVVAALADGRPHVVKHTAVEENGPAWAAG